MAMHQLTLPGEIVKKHNELVRSKINISSKTAARILACLIASIHHDDTQFKTAYVVPIKPYLPDDTGKSYQLAKEACRELLSATVEKESPDPDDPTGEPSWSGATFFTKIKYTKGNVTAEFNPKLSELLLQLRGFFTEYNLLEYLALPSTYSQRLFEILKSWSGLPEVVISVSEMHEILNTPMSFRSDFRNFRIRVLEKSHNDILSHTHLRFEWEPIKIGRSVEKIRFIFSEKRRALPEKEKEKAKEEKSRKLKNQRFLRASECAITRKGICTKQDNKPIICKLCLRMKLCEDLLHHERKRTHSIT